MYENIRLPPPPPFEHLRPNSDTPFERRFDGRSMVVRYSLLTAYRGGIGPFTFVRFGHCC